MSQQIRIKFQLQQIGLKYQFFIQMSTRNIFIETISQYSGAISIKELVNSCKNQIRLQAFKKTTTHPAELIKKYEVVRKKYEKGALQVHHWTWSKNQHKLFIWFIVSYYKAHSKAYHDITTLEWEEFSHSFHQKDILMLQYEAKSIEKSQDRVQWTPQEEDILQKSIDQNFNGEWINISKRIFYSLNGESYKTSKQCREHWFNHLDAEKIKGAWNIQQDLIILQFVQAHKKHWAKISGLLKRRRTQHSIKNRFHSLLKYASKLDQRFTLQASEADIIQFMIHELKSHQMQSQKYLESEEEASLHLSSDLQRKAVIEIDSDANKSKYFKGNKALQKQKTIRNQNTLLVEQNHIPTCWSINLINSFSQQGNQFCPLLYYGFIGSGSQMMGIPLSVQSPHAQIMHQPVGIRQENMFDKSECSFRTMGELAEYGQM